MIVKIKKLNDKRMENDYGLSPPIKDMIVFVVVLSSYTITSFI
ncbi:hypothetical protein [Clostridium beijerinckii]|nr:hypothetical protein [Clostridium beijerinckii]